ncbi:hypothetical protein AXF42_Ash019510 [Apostasia shenzhenica]|uniref:Uncharacterized protein n=1 Tax=Apostasia shenzhenica TaxID=1088818 RepID=A0A2I0A0B1_9ASPA|nr:hypothetical protein AXF42_Ash019510 [Apostasia shenzhenica]
MIRVDRGTVSCFFLSYGDCGSERRNLIFLCEQTFFVVVSQWRSRGEFFIERGIGWFGSALEEPLREWRNRVFC